MELPEIELYASTLKARVAKQFREKHDVARLFLKSGC